MHYAPLFGIEQALTRRTMAGDVCGPDERVDLPTAIRMYTIHGPLASFEESFKGSLEVSKGPTSSSSLRTSAGSRLNNSAM